MVSRGADFDIRKITSRSGSKPRSLSVVHHSPAEEADEFSTDLESRIQDALTYSPSGYAMNAATAAAETVADLGRKVGGFLYDAVADTLGTVRAAATGQPPEDPGWFFGLTSDVAANLGSKLPTGTQKALGVAQDAPSAGYLETSDGRRYSLPVGQTAQDKGEKALTAATITAMTKARNDEAAAKNALLVERAKNKTSQENFNRQFALIETRAALEMEALRLNNARNKLALDRESAGKNAWGWGDGPSRIDTSDEQPARRVRSVSAF